MQPWRKIIMTVHLQSSGSLFIISRLELAVNEFPESAPKTNKKKVTRLRWRCFPCPEEGWMRLSIHAWLRLWSSYCWWNCAVKTELLLYMITSLCVKWLITTTLQLKIDNMSHKSSCSTYVKSFASFIAQRRAVNLIIGILQGNAILWHI